MARGGRVKDPHPSIVKDAFLTRYGWTLFEYWAHPEWILEDLASAMTGEAQGASERSASGGSSSYGADMRSAAEIASSSGLPPPPGGWPMTSEQTHG